MDIYVVNKGDTLWKIANRYNVNMDLIAKVNGLQSPNQLAIGQALLIPKLNGYHRVQPGDTLWSIAHKHGVTVESIVSANEITNPNIIYPGMLLIIPTSKPIIDVYAYSYEDDKLGAKSVNEVGKSLTYFSPKAYVVTKSGTLDETPDEMQLAAAKLNNVIPTLSIMNFKPGDIGSQTAHAILSSKDLQEKLLRNVINVMDEKGYKGLNINFENVLPSDREAYIGFVQLAVNRLHPRGYIVSTALAPKTSGTQPGLLYEAHDYPALGNIVDFVVLMTYEWGYRLGPPQAISPIKEIEKVVKYALSVMPANKIHLGFEIYARDWLIPHVKGNVAETFSPQEALNRAMKYGATIQYDTNAQAPFYRYVDENGQGHEVWFEDARSAKAKFDLVKKYNLRGITYWALGFPYPENWSLLNDTFTIKKFK
ncbi:LysM peptidoglycan-binding domain-containing protein [Clostridium cylindrosporum]|uniref:Spore germination protein YaaH n=1 Tax=Clostridium cylindrosporum DSM 605 TaxID=1121307 RepID=A0A0J8DCC9_CLOCY|nr:LysM peptidoglycan-binding domain-containing protein [Clostridium cylindrosporum]KMT21964.1 spore germination protein YaaH [Clostridium cylindrosporum DSM 605]